MTDYSFILRKMSADGQGYFSEEDRLRLLNAADRIAELEAENRRLNDCFNEHGGRYWEARWRDEAAENEKLKAALKPIIPDTSLDEEEYSMVWNYHLVKARAAFLGEKHD